MAVAKPRTPKPATEDTTPEATPEAATEATAPELATPLITPADPEAPVTISEPEPLPEEKAEEVAETEPTPQDPMPEDPVAEPQIVPEAPVAAAPAAAPSRGGIGGFVLGGVIAAALGAGAAIYALPQLPQALRERIVPAAAPDPAIGALQETIATQAARIESLGTELASLKSAVPPAADMSGVTAALDEASAQARAAAEAQAALDQRLSALEKRPVEGGGVSDAALAAFQRDLDALKAQIAEAGGNASVTQQEIEAAAAAAQAQIKAAEDQATQLRADSEAAAKRTMAQAAVARLGAALDSGAPLAPALADLSAAGLALPTAISDQVPGLTTLQTGFPEAARAGLAASRRAAASGTVGDRIGAFLLAQTGARSLEPQEGNDPDAVLSRAQAAVDAGDIGKAVIEIAALPEAGQAAMADWVSAAKMRLGALEALGALAQSVQ